MKTSTEIVPVTLAGEELQPSMLNVNDGSLNSRLITAKVSKPSDVTDLNLFTKIYGFVAEGRVITKDLPAQVSDKPLCSAVVDACA